MFLRSVLSLNTVSHTVSNRPRVQSLTCMLLVYYYFNAILYFPIEVSHSDSSDGIVYVIMTTVTAEFMSGITHHRDIPYIHHHARGDVPVAAY